ncbi:MAG: hypothetical protein LWW97_02535 [Deltaproteobacteria bacterium]|nr:hypothetical protein [Deltaproteobacteria bacterium]
MQLFYLGSDDSEGYADFVILDSRKQRVMKNFQFDDTLFSSRYKEKLNSLKLYIDCNVSFIGAYLIEAD